ncbi:peptidylprolyl isomerase [Paenibacillus sp. Marseille-P2973]|uniref:peptidylprolyl isomerase n=1 Tax=Paenibacillus TaxID=44249 RepID=UPI001B39983D|nr:MULTISPECIES: peptidylprolyl isomerase [Paenibacillus]MBQ4901650.1 peptidylprolyl isomerase [Paenibacillus sp. Marseille-P2973]MDN4070698.1 peptidylprolyl isomerase [Paenibacillus vini]
MFRSKGRSWKTLLIALVAVMAFTVMAGCGKKEDKGAAGGSEDKSKVIATYEGGEITEDEFDREQRIVLALQPQMEQFMQMDDFRDYLIKQEIAYEYLDTKADAKMKEEGKKKAEEQFTAMKKSMGDDAFKQLLDGQKISESEFKNYMVRIYTVMESEKAKVTDDDVKKEFEATKENYITASVRHILIGFTDKEGKERSKEDALKVANEVKAKLDKGEDFAKLVKEYSTDGQPNIDNGGLYADTPVSNWVTEFKEKAITLPINTISEPVETTYGYHIIRVEKRTEKKFEDLTQEEKDLIKMSVASQNLDKFMEGDLEKKIIKKIELPKVEQKKEEDGATNSGTNGNADKSGTDAGTSGNDGATKDNGAATNNSTSSNDK